MFKKILCPLILLFVCISMLASCKGDKEVVSLTITNGLKTSFALNEEPDFSEVRAVAVFNDGTSATLTAKDLSFSPIDTSTIGQKQLSILYSGYVLNVTVTVTGSSLDVSFDTTNHIITAVSLPDALALWETNRNDFILPDHTYVVGDDNPFIFSLKLSVYSKEGEKVNVTSYTSASTVTKKGESAPLSGEDLSKYLSINEEKNSFDFTEAAIGQSFVITTRPRDGVSGKENQMTKSITVNVVDGYNVYNAYELNFITNNSSGFDFLEVNANETRSLTEIVDDFLINEKQTTRPEDLSALVIHKNLVIEPTDIPKEYFHDYNRNNEINDYTSVFDHINTEEKPHFTIHGNYFAIYATSLPNVVPYGVGNQDNEISNSMLFEFSVDRSLVSSKTYDHTKYSTTINNLMITGDNPQNDNEATSKNSLYGHTAVRTTYQVMNLNNVNISAFFMSLSAEFDYQTVNLNKCILHNAWQNHIHLLSCNYIQAADEEPLPQSIYPRLKLNVKQSNISQSGGPAIIMQTLYPSDNCSKFSGAEVHVSEDSVVESWVTGEEAWFKIFQITFVTEMVKNYDRNLQALDSSFIKEDIRIVDGKKTKVKLMNIVAVNLMVPDVTGGLEGIFEELQGKTDIDGKYIVGDVAVMDMDDYTYNGKTYNFYNQTIAEKKAESTDNHALTNTSGGIAIAGPSSPFKVVEGDLSAQSENDYLTMYFYTLGIILGNYHPI